MSDTPRTLSINFGNFSVALDGYDDPFPIMKQITEFLETRADENPDEDESNLTDQPDLQPDLAKALAVQSEQINIADNVVTISAREVVELPEIPNESNEEKLKISENLRDAIESHKRTLADNEEQKVAAPLTLQNLISEEEMAEVEMTFATERGTRKPAPLVDLEEHAEAGSELPFVGKSGNKNAQPKRAKVRIIRNDYSELLEDAQTKQIEENAEPQIDLPKVDAPEAPAPKRKFRKLKPDAGAVAETPEAEKPAVEMPQPKPPANTPYRKLKAN